MTEIKNNTNDDLQSIIIRLSGPLSTGEQDNYAKTLLIIDAKLLALQAFIRLHGDHTTIPAPEDAHIASACIVDLMKSDEVGTDQKRFAAKHYVTLVELRDADMPAESLDTVFDVIAQHINGPSTGSHWRAVRTDLRAALHTAINAAQLASMLPDLLFYGLIDSISGEGVLEYNRAKGVRFYISLIDANDNRISAENLISVSDMIGDRIRTAELCDQPNVLAIWSELNERLGLAVKLREMREIFARPLPKDDAERRAAPDILKQNFRALRLFQNLLETDGQSIASTDVEAAIGCTIKIMTSDFHAGNTDKKEAVFLYIDLLKLRPEDVRPESLDIVFDVIKICAHGNFPKWMECNEDLQDILQELRQSVNQSGFTPSGIDIETSPSLSALIFKGLMHEISDGQYANTDAISACIDMVRLDDSRIDTKNLIIVSNKIVKGTEHAQRERRRALFFDDDYSQSPWNGLAEKFSMALETSRWKPAVIDPARTLETLSTIIEDKTLTDRQILPVALRMLKIVDAHVGVDGEFRYQRIPEQTLEAAHDALLTRMWSEPISNLAEQFWHRANTGRAPALVTA